MAWRSDLPRRWVLVVAAAVLAGGASAAPVIDEKPFLAENDAAMARMMAAMTIRPSGDADVDFATMMIPHHRGAIDMAQAELRFGRNERLRRIAQEIVVEQQQEIVAMRLALGRPLPPSAPAPTQPSASLPSPEPMKPGGATPMAHDPMPMQQEQ